MLRGHHNSQHQPPVKAPRANRHREGGRRAGVARLQALDVLQVLVLGDDLLVRVGLGAEGTLAALGGGEVTAVGVGARGEGVCLCWVVEEQGGLLEGAALGLDGEEVDVDRLEDVPHGVDDVVLPVERGPRDRVGVLVEDERGSDTQAVKGEVRLAPKSKERVKSY